MKRHLFLAGLAAGVLIIACTTANTTDSTSSSGGTSSGTSGGSSGTSGTAAEGGAEGGSSGSSGDVTVPAASTTEGDIAFSSTCPAFAACGGELSGTYDYLGGCAGDLFASAKQNCSGLDASKANVKIQGSIYFLAGGALQRNITTKITGTLTFPASCVAGQCAVVEAALKGQFGNSKCTAAGSACDCTLDKTETNTDATTFTVSGDTVTTADGETYKFCVGGSTLKYSGKSSGSQDGIWDLKKR